MAASGLGATLESTGPSFEGGSSSHCSCMGCGYRSHVGFQSLMLCWLVSQRLVFSWGVQCDTPERSTRFKFPPDCGSPYGGGWVYSCWNRCILGCSVKFCFILFSSAREAPVDLHPSSLALSSAALRLPVSPWRWCSFVTLGLISTLSFWFFLSFFISLLTFPLWYSVLPMFSISTLHILIRVISNSSSGISYMRVEPEPGPDECMKKSMHSTLHVKCYFM